MSNAACLYGEGCEQHPYGDPHSRALPAALPVGGECGRSPSLAFPAGAQERGGPGGSGISGEEIAGLKSPASEVPPADERWGGLTCGTAFRLHTVFSRQGAPRRGKGVSLLPGALKKKKKKPDLFLEMF